jgi:hypothetical protein
MRAASHNAHRPTLTKEILMLVPGDKFPEITLSLVGGGEITLPRDVQESWAYIMFYRGGW